MEQLLQAGLVLLLIAGGPLLFELHKHEGPMRVPLLGGLWGVGLSVPVSIAVLGALSATYGDLGVFVALFVPAMLGWGWALGVVGSIAVQVVRRWRQGGA